eukprot:12929545-Prorocentrum_lima.AAC.1
MHATSSPAPDGDLEASHGSWLPGDPMDSDQPQELQSQIPVATDKSTIGSDVPIMPVREVAVANFPTTVAAASIEALGYMEVDAVSVSAAHQLSPFAKPFEPAGGNQ